MFSEEYASDAQMRNNELFATFIPRAAGALGAILIQGTRHYGFSDLPQLSPLAPLLGLKGPINGKRLTTIVDDYLVSFFDVTLTGGRSALFEGAERYPEARVE